ncbi:mannose-1-phosphate guanylyltransferase [Algoriphagus jejuensis]|uniref:Mannose-1-phosphate guanylyltransferase n=1 Tax=Algoriphagus jejuensis TaxID=419934 RepID=A0ABP3YHN5_9BACT
MQHRPYIVILAGGIGSRFWPYSRTNRPKQFLDILGTGRTLLQMTYDRFLAIAKPDRFFVVTNHAYLELVKEQLPDLKPEQILTEPLRRNTAACAAYAAYRIHSFDREATLIVTPADQLILKEDRFIATIEKAVEAAQVKGRLVTMGIRPNRADTGFGYIQYLESENGDSALKVKTFTEKPNLKLAKTFLESGDFAWNSGMFVWKVGSLLEALSENLPDVAETFEEGKNHFGKSTEREFVFKAYSLVKNVSLDLGIMEKSDNVYVILGDYGWSDLGSWHGLHDLREKDEHNNVVDGNVLLYDTKNSYVKVDSKKLVVVEGLDHYLINESENVLLICKLDGEKKFRDFVANAKKKGEDFI